MLTILVYASSTTNTAEFGANEPVDFFKFSLYTGKEKKNIHKKKHKLKNYIYKYVEGKLLVEMV